MIYFLIAAYNEEPNLTDLLKNISSFFKAKKQIIIVDDGSTDDSKNIINKLAKRYPVSRIGYKKNKGMGHAFKFGFNFIIPKLEKTDLVITMDADNTTDYTKLSKMILLAKDKDIVLSSPHAKGGKFIGVSRFRTFLSKISAYSDCQIFRIKGVRTYTSIYRIYSAEILKKMSKVYGSALITQNGFPAAVETLVKAYRVGANIAELPATVDWNKRKGKSKMRIFKAARSHLNLYYDFISGKYDS